jgi:hypothetical protein
MSEKKEKKPFNETGFGKFLNKAGKHIGTAIEVGAEIATGDIAGALDIVKGKIQESSISEVEKAKLLQEMELSRMAWIKEMFQLEVQDRESARDREAALAANGMRDWFQYVVGSVGLICFGFIIYTLIFRVVPESNREMFIHLLGIVEGVVISIFSYYFGSSLGSKRKDLKQ